MNKFFLMIIMLLLSGCATSVWDAKWGAYKPHISFVSLSTTEDQADKLYVWNPDNNAAYVFNPRNADTAACLASADVAKSRNFENEIKIGMDKIKGSTEGITAGDTLKVVDTLTRISEKGEAVSFLNVALFHICMMSGSGKINSEDATELMGMAIEKAAGFGVK